MAKKRAVASGRTLRRISGLRRPSVMSEREADAYLATRETLRRIARASQVASLTAGAVTITWSPAFQLPQDQ